MKYFEQKLIMAVGIIVIGLIFSFNVPDLGVFYFGFFGLVWKMFSAYYLEDELIKLILYIFVGAILFGSVYLTNKQENKVWKIVTVIMAIVGIIRLLVFKKLL